MPTPKLTDRQILILINKHFNNHTYIQPETLQRLINLIKEAHELGYKDSF